MRRWLLALLLATAAPAEAQPRDVLGTIDACVARLDHGHDLGYPRIAARCPELAPSLAQSEWAPWLPQDWNQADNQLSADGLAELRTLLSRAAPAPAGARAPRVANVAAVLARITQPDAPRDGWWARFKRWLHGVLDPRPEREDDGWLRRLIGNLKLSEAVLRSISWASVALVVALAAAVVVNELRVAGVFGRGRHRRVRAGAAAMRRPGPTLAELEQASPSQRPQLLLELVTARLGEQQRLPPPRALTLHELTRAAQLPQESDREGLRQLTTVCERVRFSGREIAPSILAAALARGRELLAALDAASLQPQDPR